MIALADSGILIRYFQPADAAYIGIHATLSRLQSSGDELVIALQNVAEFWNVCTRPKTARGGLGLSIPETSRRLQISEKRIPILSEHAGTYAIWRGLIVHH